MECNNNKILNSVHEQKGGDPVIVSGSKRKNLKRNNQDLYDGISYMERESTGRPGTPHRFFSKSYSVKINKDIAEGSNVVSRGDNLGFLNHPRQVVHQHANSLVVVTAGDVVRDEICKRKTRFADTEDSWKIKNFDYLQSVSSSQTVGGKRKRNKKIMETAEKIPGIVCPTDDLAVVTFMDGSTLYLKCCVAGTILELNERMPVPTNGGTNNQDGRAKDTLSLLEEDPLLDGYLAVIMPNGFEAIHR